MTTLIARLLSHAEARPESVAISHVSPAGVTDIAWRDLAARVIEWGRAFRSLGAGRGRPVLVFLPHAPEMYDAFFGAMSAGLIPSFMPLPSLKQDPAHYWASHRTLVERIRPAAIVAPEAFRDELVGAGVGLDPERIVTERFAAHVHEAPPDAGASLGPLSPQDVALLQHTSGTTGLKKGVALSHEAILRQCETYARAVGLTSDSVIASWLPLYHDMGLIACLVGTVATGNRLVAMDAFHWLNRPGRLLDLAQTYRATHVWLPNFAFDHLVNTVRRPESYDLSGVTAFVSCSEVVRDRSLRRFAQHFAPAGVTLNQCAVSYAMAETVFAVTQSPVGRPYRVRHVVDAELGPGTRIAFAGEPGRAVVSCGPPLPGVELRIVDADRRALPDGTVGEVAIRAPFLFSGYFALPEKTAETLDGGWYHAADLGFLDEGELYVLGRADDAIILNGKNIFANEVEQSLNAVEALKPGRIAVVGLDDSRVGSQRLIVLAELKDEIEAAARDGVGDAVSRLVAQDFGVDVHDVWLVPAGTLHKSTSGKISRRKNLELYVTKRGSHGRA